MNNEVYDFGLRLKNMRKTANLTQEEVAKRLDVTVGTIRKYENNTSLPPVDKLEIMALIYRTSLDYLRNLEKRSNIFIDDLPIPQQNLIKSVIDNLRKELEIYNKTGD